MGGFFMSATSATTPMVDSYIPARIDDTIIWRPNFNHERRGPAATWARRGGYDLWPGSSMMSGDPAVPMTTFGNDSMSGGEYFEPPSCIGSGTQTTKFVRGLCLDSAGVPVAGAIVQGFVTATDTLVGEVTSATDGTYALGTNNLSSTQHYLVAYKAGSPDTAGTTVNTLLPTNIDGT